MVLMVLLLAGLLTPAVAQERYSTFENRWKPGHRINIETGSVRATPTQPGWWSKDWRLERVGNFVRLKSRWTNCFIHIENDRVECSEIQDGWHSAQWSIRQTPEGYVRLENRWRGCFLNIERGPVVCGPIEMGWWSAMWIMR
jgi:hypothetical protein